MKTLVTGGAGFVGAHLVRALLAQGRQVVVADLMPPSDRTPLGVLGKLSSVEYTQIDLSDSAAVNRRIVEQFDTVFHLAAQPIGPVPGSQQIPTFINNINAARSIVQLVRRGQVRNLIFASSACVFGFPDRRDCPLKEEAPKSTGMYAYGESKRQTEELVRRLGGRACIARFVNLFGEGDWHGSRIIPKISRQLARAEKLSLSRSNGRSVLDFLYVHDAVAGMLSLEINKELFIERNIAPIFNFAYGMPISIIELIEEICLSLGLAYNGIIIPEVPPEPEVHKFLDSSRARTLLGWAPSVDRRHALKQTGEWYAKNEWKLDDRDRLHSAPQIGDVSAAIYTTANAYLTNGLLNR